MSMRHCEICRCLGADTAQVLDNFPPEIVPYLQAILVSLSLASMCRLSSSPQSDLDSYLGKQYRQELEGVASGAGLDLGAALPLCDVSR